MFDTWKDWSFLVLLAFLISGLLFTGGRGCVGYNERASERASKEMGEAQDRANRGILDCIKLGKALGECAAVFPSK
jgi:hypothetical protein